MDKNGHWVHIAVAALVGGAIGALVNGGMQLYASGGDWSKIDWGQVTIAGVSGAAGGALMSAGVPAPVAGAVIGGASDLAMQLYGNGGKFGQVDWLNVGFSTVSGAAMGVVGGVLSGIAGLPNIPVAHLNSMGRALTTRIGNAVMYQLGRGATREISGALKYYFTQTATEVWKTIIKTMLIEGVRDTTIEKIIDGTGLSGRAKNKIRAALA